MIERATERSTDLDSFTEWDVPPIARCALCSRLECEGCNPARRKNKPLPGRTSGGSLARCWSIARQSVSSGAAACVDMDAPRPWRALGFAVLAEVLASVSVVASLGAVLLLAFPDAAGFLLQSREMWAASLLLALGLAAFLVLVHVVWGLALELLLFRKADGFRFRCTLSFALYACGWDLLTSPLGVVVLLWSRGVRGAMSEVAAAMRAPRPSVTEYLVEHRKVSPAAARSSVLGSFVAAVGFTLAWLVASLAWLLYALLG